MFARTALSLAAALLVAAAPALAAPVAARPAAAPAAPARIVAGMRIQSQYAGAYYPGTLKAIKGNDTYVIRSDGYGHDSEVGAWRLRTAAGVEFLDLLKDPQRMAAQAREKKTGKDYFVGVWKTSNNPTWQTTKVEDRGTYTNVTQVYNLQLVRGVVRINANGTYEHTMYGKGTVYRGTWTAVAPGTGILKPKNGGILLRKGHLLGGDLLVTREPQGAIRLVNAKFGGAGYTGAIIPAK